MKRLSIFLALMLLSFFAFAEQPSIGSWYNPHESGRGWNIERQNDVITVAHYVYKSDGSPTFYISSGVWDGSTKSVLGDIYEFSGGQCIGCIYSVPSSENLGSVKFEFTSSVRGRVTYPDGTSIAIEKMNYGFSSPLHVLQGAWATSWYSSTGAGFEHAMVLSDIVSTESGKMVSGKTLYSSAGRIVVATAVEGIYIAIVDATTNFYDYYYYTIDGETLKGLGCTGRKTSPAPSISACRGILFGSRTHTHREASGIFSQSVKSKEGAWSEVDRERSESAQVEVKSQFLDSFIDREDSLYIGMQELRGFISKSQPHGS